MATGENTWFAVPEPRTACEFEFHTDRHRIHECYIIYLHLFDVCVKSRCVRINHTWILWDPGFYRIFTKHVVLAMEWTFTFLQAIHHQHM